MKSFAFSSISTLAGIGAAVAAKSAIGSMWPSDPPQNPADRSVTWTDAVRWTLVASLGAGVSRLVARRLAAAGWEKVTDEKPPGM